MVLQKHEKESVEPSSTEEPSAPAGEVVLATVTSMDSGQAIIRYNVGGVTFERAALTTLAVQSDMVGRQVAISFVGGDLQQPIVLGVVYSPLYQMLESYGHEDKEIFSEISLPDQVAVSPLQEPVVVDGRRVVIEGSDQVELKCGDASIVLTKSGKILIRGKYVLNRASGVNRILGGSVQVN